MSGLRLRERQASVEVLSTGRPGPSGLYWDNAGWVLDATYRVHAALLHGGSSYRALVEHEASAATEPGVGSHWQEVWEVLAARAELTAEFVALREAVQAAAQSAEADAAQSALDRIGTGEDRVQTGLDRAVATAEREQAALDRIATGQDREQTGANVAASQADRQQTSLDRVATAADREQARLDRVATGQDRTQTNLDRVRTAEDVAQTALDRAQTGQDVVQTGEDRVATGQDRIATADDRRQTGEDRDATAQDRIATSDDRTQTGLDRVATEAARLVWHDAGWAVDIAIAKGTGLANKGASYRAIVDHVSAPENEPGVGANWQQSWAVLAAQGSPGIVGREYPVYVYRADGTNIAMQGYVAALYCRSAGTLSHFFAKVTHGTGQCEVTVLKNDQPVYGPVTVVAGAPVSASGLAIAVAVGDAITYAVGAVAGVNGLWVQLDGADA